MQAVALSAQGACYIMSFFMYHPFTTQMESLQRNEDTRVVNDSFLLAARTSPPVNLLPCSSLFFNRIEPTTFSSRIIMNYNLDFRYQETVSWTAIWLPVNREVKDFWYHETTWTAIWLPVNRQVKDFRYHETTSIAIWLPANRHVNCRRRIEVWRNHHQVVQELVPFSMKGTAIFYFFLLIEKYCQEKEVWPIDFIVDDL